MGWGVIKEFGVCLKCANFEIMVIESLNWIPTNLPLPSLSGLSQLNLGQKIVGLKLIVI